MTDQAPPTVGEQIVSIVTGYVDERLRVHGDHYDERLDQLAREVRELQARQGGMWDAMIDMDTRMKEAANLPEHVYRNFIKAEAERLRLVKPVRKGTGE